MPLRENSTFSTITIASPAVITHFGSILLRSAPNTGITMSRAMVKYQCILYANSARPGSFSDTLYCDAISSIAKVTPAVFKTSKTSEKVYTVNSARSVILSCVPPRKPSLTSHVLSTFRALWPARSPLTNSANIHSVLPRAGSMLPTAERVRLWVKRLIALR